MTNDRQAKPTRRGEWLARSTTYPLVGAPVCWPTVYNPIHAPLAVGNVGETAGDVGLSRLPVSTTHESSLKRFVVTMH